MENQVLMFFICLMAPLSMMLLVFKGRNRTLLIFLLIGIFLCLFAGEINGFILSHTHYSAYYLTVQITPIVEELLKALPVVMAAFLLEPDRQFLLETSLAVGVGFATLENVSMLTLSGSLGLPFVLARGFGAGMMHGVSTLAVGYSMTFVRKDRKLSYCGTLAALSVAILYHSIYNILVQSARPEIGMLMPIATYIPLIFAMRKRKQN